MNKLIVNKSEKNLVMYYQYTCISRITTAGGAKTDLIISSNNEK